MKGARIESARDLARKRAEAIKDRLTVVRLAEIRGAEIASTDGGGHAVDCPACHAPHAKGRAVSVGASGRTWACASCKATGDVITFEMAATGADFRGACAALDLLAETPADPATGNLFASGATGSIVQDLLAFLALAGGLSTLLFWVVILTGGAS